MDKSFRLVERDKCDLPRWALFLGDTGFQSGLYFLEQDGTWKEVGCVFTGAMLLVSVGELTRLKLDTLELSHLAREGFATAIAAGYRRLTYNGEILNAVVEKVAKHGGEVKPGFFRNLFSRKTTPDETPISQLDSLVVSIEIMDLVIVTPLLAELLAANAVPDTHALNAIAKTELAAAKRVVELL